MIGTNKHYGFSLKMKYLAKITGADYTKKSSVQFLQQLFTEL